MDGGLLPAPWTSVKGSLDEQLEAARILTGQFNHDALAMFNDPKNGNLADGEVRMYYQIKADTNRVDTSILARLNTGDPFLVETKYGQGSVIQCATPCDSDWGNLPMRSFYLPMVQRLTTYLASTVFPPRNVGVGQPLVGLFPKDQAGKQVQVSDPSGRTHSIRILSNKERAVAEYADTSRPGQYIMTGPDKKPIHFIVRTSREESDLRLLDEDQLKTLAADMGADLVNSADEYKKLDRSRRFGQEIWKPLFWAVLLLIFLELFLEQRFAGIRKANATVGKEGLAS